MEDGVDRAPGIHESDAAKPVLMIPRTCSSMVLRCYDLDPMMLRACCYKWGCRGGAQYPARALSTPYLFKACLR